MESIREKLSRVTALRPDFPLADLKPERRLPAGSERLVQLLGGESRANRMGNHVVVRRILSRPTACELDGRGLDFILPFSSAALCDPYQWLFLDTETTGLAGGTGTYAFLVGLAWWGSTGLVIEQYFMRDYGEEASMLSGLLECLSRYSVLVTFNGKSFDWPLLQTRFQMKRLKTLPVFSEHLDLLHPARQIWRTCCNPVTLVKLEKHVLGIDRERDIRSEMIPRIYFDFLRGGRPEDMVEVFRHNQMDLYGLASLALHILRLLSDPERCADRPEELYGVSRLLERRGHARLAKKIYRRALDAGLPQEIESVARRELGFLAKREGDFKLSNEQWEKLLCHPTEWLRAYEQLAIYYEHYGRLPEQAAALSREALIKIHQAFRSGRVTWTQYVQWYGSFRHRLDRLKSRLATGGRLP